MSAATTPPQLTEENYQRLVALFAKRDSLVSEQKFSLLWLMTLQRLEVPEDNVKSLDMRDGNRLVGVWLNRPDYAGKLRRKERARVALQAQHERDQDLRSCWGMHTIKPMGRSWDRSDYVAIDPPLYPPAGWLKQCQVKA